MNQIFHLINMDKIGYKYTEPTLIDIENGQYVSQKGNKLLICKESVFMYDIHYFEKNPKSPLFPGTIVSINYCWMNFYGKYVNVSCDGKIMI